MAVFGKFMNMDKLIGPDFEKGLARLKAVAEEPTPDGSHARRRNRVRASTAAVEPSNDAAVGQTTVQVSPPPSRPASA